MPSTVFSAGTVITAAWLNDINKGVLQPSLKTTIGGTTIADFTINHATTDGRVFFADTVPMDWATGPGKMSVEFELTPTGYFAANPNGHFAIILRQDPATITTAVRGQGIACGNATSFPTYPAGGSDLNPTTMVETWFNGLHGTGNFLWGNSDAARSHGGLQDGTRYKFIVESTKTVDDNRYIRYRMWSYQAALENWQMEVDSGDILDHNAWADLTQSGLFFAQVFESNLSTWSLPFTNIKVTWGPADLAVPDQTIKLSRYGAQLEGDLQFIGNARRIKAPYSAGTSLVNFLTVQTSTANSATSFVVKPSGSATIANTLYSNHSTSSTTWQGVTVGMTSTEALIESLALSATTLPVGINVGVGTRIATFKTTGIRLLTGTIDIGVPLTFNSSFVNAGGSVATTFVATTGGWDWEAMSTSGTISTYLTTTYDKNKLEDMIRPLYCLFSYIIKNLQDKKVI